MDAAAKVLLEQGLAGALLVMFLLAIIYLQKKRDEDGEARLKDSRETLLTVAEMNRLVGGLKDAVAGLTQSLASLTSTVQTMHADSKSVAEFNRVRDDRVERMIEGNGEIIRETQSILRTCARRDDSKAG